MPRQGTKNRRPTTGPAESKARKEAFLDLIREGHTIAQALAHESVSVTHSAYKKWRERDHHFAINVDICRAGRDAVVGVWNGTHASFAEHYFGMSYAWFQLLYIEELEKLPPGNILMALWPPEHGKTTTYENYASETLAVNPEWRGTVASENLTIATKIVSRIKNRLEPDGPFPKYVSDWGPFKPQSGQGSNGKIAQPWGSGHFNVFKKSAHDERDYSLMALGFGSSIVSTRTDHLHIDDIQSTKTLNQSNKIESWFRQDALSRPGEHGITTIAGTRVGEDDFYERIANDPDLDGILKVMRFKAVMTNPLTGEQTALWPERYDLDQLDRQRRKVGQEAWDRNYMQEPGASDTNRTFTEEAIERALNPNLSLKHRCNAGSIVYVGLDPALGSNNCIIACEVTSEGQLIVRRIREDVGFQQNEQIMAALGETVEWCNVAGGRVTDVVIESMVFQKGLARDERLQELSYWHGFACREHLTGWNKYDENIGVASMVTSFLSGEVVLPWADDDLTRHEIGELVRQLRAWKPGKRGSKLRQDRVMALWFVWILWRSRWKIPTASANNPDAWRRKGLPYRGTRSGLVLPTGVRL
jgi:hypothetical protein